MKKEENINFKFEQVTKENLSDLVFLQKLVGGSKTVLSHFEKKFNSPTTLNYIGYFAYAPNGEPAGFYGVFPLKMERNGVEIDVAQSGDTVTNPKYQRMGLFTILAKKTFDLANKNGVSLIFGFPNSLSSKGFFGRLNWSQVGEMKTFEFKYNSFRLYNLLNKIKVTQSLYSLYVRLILLFLGTSTFENSLKNKKKWTIKHDSSFYNYKKYNTSYFVKINNVKFWIKFDDGISIGDIKFQKKTDEEKLMYILKKLALVFGVNKVRIITSNSNPLINLIKQQEPSNILKIGSLFFNNTELGKTDFTGGDIDTF